MTREQGAPPAGGGSLGPLRIEASSIVLPCFATADRPESAPSHVLAGQTPIYPPVLGERQACRKTDRWTGFNCPQMPDYFLRWLSNQATIWCMAAVGILAGLGHALLACAAATILLLANVMLHWVEHRFFAGTGE